MKLRAMTNRNELTETDLTTDLWDVRPRRLWQLLFDFYRHKGGDLTHLDNLLIDYEFCKQLFTEFETSDAAVFFFSCEKGSFITQCYRIQLMQLEPDTYPYWLRDLKYYLSTCDHVLAVGIVGHGSAVFTAEVTESNVEEVVHSIKCKRDVARKAS